MNGDRVPSSVPAPVWETGPLACGQCDAPVGYGRWQTIVEDCPPALILAAAEKLRVKRPVVFCTQECMAAHETRAALTQPDGAHFDTWVRDGMAESGVGSHPMTIQQTLASGKTVIFKGVLK